MSEQESKPVDSIDELAARVLLGAPEPGDGEKLGRLLADSAEARERFLDHATIQSFLVEEGKAGSFAPDRAALFDVIEGGGEAKRHRHPLRWVSAAAAAVTIGLLGIFALNLPGRADAAMESLEAVIAAFGRLEDRSYVIHVSDEGGRRRGKAKSGGRSEGAGRFHPAAHLDGARLHLRGEEQFVLEQSLPNGEDRVMGGDGEISWSFRGNGPVRISEDPQRFRGGVPGGRQDLTFLDLRSQLDELKDLYQLEVLEPKDGNAALRGLRGSRHSREQGGAKRVEIWFDRDNGMIQRMVLAGLPRDNGRPGRIELELVSTEPLAADFFTHDAHHSPDRAIEPEPNRRR